MNIYKSLRMVIVTLLSVGLLLFAALYVVLSMPSVQNYVCSEGEKELSKLLGTNVEIGAVSISPFHDLVLHDVYVPDQKGDSLLYVKELGAGISIYNLLASRRLVFTYGEIIGMKGHITKQTPDSPTNMQFIIDALSSKDKTKPPTKFDIKIYNVVIRKSNVTFDVLSEPHITGEFDKNHISISNLRADVALPRLKNDDFIIDVKRVSFGEKCGFVLNNLASQVTLNNRLVALKNLRIELENSLIVTDSIGLAINGISNLKNDIKSLPIDVELNDVVVTPSDLRGFVPVLEKFDEQFKVALRASGNADAVRVAMLKASSQDGSVSVDLNGNIGNLGDAEHLVFDVPHVSVDAKAAEVVKITSSFSHLNDQLARIINECGNVAIHGKTKGDKHNVDFVGNIFTSVGDVKMKGRLSNIFGKRLNFGGKVVTDKLMLGRLLGKESTFGDVALDAEIDAKVNGKNVDGKLKGEVPYIDIKGYRYSNIVADVLLDGDLLDGSVTIYDDNLQAMINGVIKKAGDQSEVDLGFDMIHADLAALNLMKGNDRSNLSFNASANFFGNKLDNATGEVLIKDFALVDNSDVGLHIESFLVEANNESDPQNITLTSDFLNGKIVGSFDFVSLVPTLQNILAQSLPSLIPRNDDVESRRSNDFKFDFTLDPSEELQTMFKLPVNVVYKTTLNGFVNEPDESFAVNFNAPYLQQGKKIIESTFVEASKRANEQNVRVTAQTIFPLKKGKTVVTLNGNGVNDRLDTDLSWRVMTDRAYKGTIDLSTLFRRGSDDRMAMNININPTELVFNDTIWQVKPASVNIDGGVIAVNNIRGVCANQRVVIDGLVSNNASDMLVVELNQMSLDYVFETLGIDNVMFGGVATGKFFASNLLSGSPILETPGLHVDRIAYNKCVMGDADIISNWDNDTKAINLHADIDQDNGLRSQITGAIYPMRDSLSINFDAHKAKLGFLQPFMSAITSHIEGEVSGKACLYGDFHNINLYGDIFADYLKFKVDYTNVYYTASDSVHIVPGLIEFNDITILDRDGHTAKVNGWLRHDNFHRPVFDFNITHARNFLCYDVTPALSPDWYGTVYGNGSAYVKGGPGICTIGVNMESRRNSKFTFVLSDEIAASEYTFITFRDRNRKDNDEEQDSIPKIVRELTAKNVSTESKPSVFKIDISADITNDAQLTVVMDPVGGDKIRGYGKGNLRLTYDSTDESLGMYGKYELEKGSYNFTLQDIIIKDFTIMEGSGISFNGDPYSANLDIRAVYSLNANLLDLDESFASDRELNRTNVPVNAILIARGDMRGPDISFDLDFPTISTDAARKVKSIVSTDDMMNRQILYLLALNRFYTPEYMGNTNRGNELTSVASSTLSSQLANVLGQLSDNWSIAPNFRSDKGDFSDVEVDLALSSQLLNNRLLFNGNFGYRDNSMNTRNSNFIGDFDIEYLLNRRGTVRLKAYNHFNDQNYLVRSALTTQGVGVEFKFDFDNPFRRRRKVLPAKTDSATNVINQPNDPDLIK
ncbi:MAG: translocation/assembly module TamB domain-containing protein [Muribaculaceae bacterium]